MTDIQVRNEDIAKNFHEFIGDISIYLYSVLSSGNSISLRNAKEEERLLSEYNRLCGLKGKDECKSFLNIPLKHLSMINDDYFSTEHISKGVDYGDGRYLFSKTIYESLLLNEKPDSLIRIRDIFPLNHNESKGVYDFNNMFDNYINIDEKDFDSLDIKDIKSSLINKMISKTKNNNKDRKPIIAVCSAIKHAFVIVAVPDTNSNTYSLKLIDSSHVMKDKNTIKDSNLNDSLKEFFLDNSMELCNDCMQENHTCYAYQGAAVSCLLRELLNNGDKALSDKLQNKEELTNDIMKQVAIGYFLPAYKEKEKRFTSFINRLNEIQKKNNKEIDVNNINNIKEDLLADRFIVKNSLDDVVKNIVRDYVNNDNSNIHKQYLNKKINNIKEEIDPDITIRNNNENNKDSINNNRENIVKDDINSIITANNKLMTEHTKNLLKNFANKHKKLGNKTTQDMTINKLLY